MAILELQRRVRTGYGTAQARTEVLKGIDLTVEDGELLAVLGFSGTGKTTLISLLAGLRKPDKGEVLFKGKRVTGPGPERGVVFQSYALMPWLTVWDNIALAVNAVHERQVAGERKALTEKYMGMVGLTHASDRRPAELSGGMRQRVSVARALAMQPEVLLLDEPLVGARRADARQAAGRVRRRSAPRPRRRWCSSPTMSTRRSCSPTASCRSNPDGTLGPSLPRRRSRARATASRSITTRPINRLRGRHHALSDGGRRAAQAASDGGVADCPTWCRSSPRRTSCPRPTPSEAAKARREDRYLDFSQIVQDVSHAERPAHRGRRLRPQDAQGRVHLADRPLRLRQVDGSVDGRRAAERDLGRHLPRRPRGARGRPRPRRRVPGAVAGAVADGGAERRARRRPRLSRRHARRAPGRGALLPEPRGPWRRQDQVRRRALQRHEAARRAGTRLRAVAQAAAAGRAVRHARQPDALGPAGGADGGVDAHQPSPPSASPTTSTRRSCSPTAW